MERNLGLNTIRVEKQKLLDALHKNKDKHVLEYTESLKGYREEVLKKLSNKVKEIKKTEDKELPGVNLYLSLAVPESHEGEYKVAIDMLEWSIDSHVDLTQQDFKSYILDEWSWKESFTRTAMMYNSSK